MSGMAQISVSLSTWKALEAQRLSFQEDHDAIIRRVLVTKKANPLRAALRPDLPVQRRRGNLLVEVAGRTTPVANLKDGYITILSQLVKIRPSLFQQLLKEGSQRRRWIATRAEALFPLSPHLSRDHAHQIAPTWFVDTNLSKAQIDTRLLKACEIAGLGFGKNVQILNA
jgi:hypothetical protein